MKEELKFQVLINEYQNLRTEIETRVQQSDKYTELSLLVIGAYVTFLQYVDISNRIILIGFPMALYALIFITVRNDYMVLICVQYIHLHIKVQIDELLNTNKDILLNWENFRYNNDLNSQTKIRIMSTFLTGVRFGIPFLSIIFIAIFYIIRYFNSFNYIDGIVCAFFLFGTILFLAVMIIWIPYCTKSYKNIAMLNKITDNSIDLEI